MRLRQRLAIRRRTLRSAPLRDGLPGRTDPMSRTPGRCERLDLPSAVTGLVLMLVVASSPARGAEPLRTVHLSPDDARLLAQPAENRTLLGYLASCALPETMVLQAEIGNEQVIFPGSLGLAPGWADRALTSAEQRWVSACLLARTNYLGHRMRISMRATDPPVDGLKTTAEEEREFSLFEGGFFGNVFAESPVAFACTGGSDAVGAADPVYAKRVCTLPTVSGSSDIKPISRCGFTLVGSCGRTNEFAVDGQHYDEVIFTYLAPEQPEPGDRR